jgi:hypothetical protein
MGGTCSALLADKVFLSVHHAPQLRLVQERRTALISAAVTRQIDVRTI